MSYNNGTAHDIILSACRNDKLKTRGFWGMRTNVALGCPRCVASRAACAVIELNRTGKERKCHPFTYENIILASGSTWEDVLAELQAKGEL